MSTVISNLYVAITSCQKLKTHHALIRNKTYHNGKFCSKNYLSQF